MNKYEKFNDMKVDLNEFNITPEDRDNFKVDDIEKKKILNKIKGKKKNYRKVIVGIAAAFVIIISIGFTDIGNKVFAKVQMYLENVFVSDFKVHGNTLKGNFASKINKTVQFGEAEIKLVDAIVYDNKLMLSTLIKLPEGYNKKEEEIPTFKEIYIKINGKEYSSLGASSVVGKDNERDGYYISSDSIYLSEDLPKGKYDIEVIYDGLNNLYRDNIESSIDEKVTIKGEIDTKLVEKNQKRYKVNEVIKTEEFNFTIKDINLNSIETSIEGTFKFKDKNIGNKYGFDIRIIGSDGYDHVAMSSNTSSSGNEVNSEYIYDSVASEFINNEFKIKDKIKIQFYRYNKIKNEDDVLEFEKYGKPFTIKLK